MDKKIQLLDNSFIPTIGQGTWFMGEKVSEKEKEISALQYGISKGMNLIDTAEMYGSGGAEQVVGEAIKNKDRSKLYIVSKVYPHNAGEKNIFSACEQTLKRLETDYLDLYLLHWRGSVPLSETVACMEKLVQQGKIKRWGVSNFDTEDMKELWQVEDGNKCVVNQVLYHLGSRGIEYDLLPWMEKHQVATMAYCPLAQAGTLRKGLFNNEAVKTVAKKHGISVAQVLLGFVLNKKNMIAIPKAASIKHVAENAAMNSISLDSEDIKLLNKHYPIPAYKMPLDIV